MLVVDNCYISPYRRTPVQRSFGLWATFDSFGSTNSHNARGIRQNLYSYWQYTMWTWYRQWLCLCGRCPTTSLLDLLFYTSHRLSWGVRFAVPKYQAFDSLHVACNAYVCDSEPPVHTSARCDRSCVNRTTTTATTTRQSRRRRRSDERQLAETQFTVVDSGYGPVIDTAGRMRLDSRTSVSLHSTHYWTS